MLNADDIVQMKADLLAVRDDRPASIVIRRGDDELDAQTVRMARSSRGRGFQSEGAEEKRGDVVVMGDVDLDIQVGDRFTVSGVGLLRVVFVRPNQDAAVTAEAVIVQ
jgi:hypothetical protein